MLPQKVIGVASFKGGVGKTTTAIHFAAFFSPFGKTLLIDDDRNKSARAWGEAAQEAGQPLPFEIVNNKQAHSRARDAQFIIIDSPAGATPQDMAELVEAVDFLVVPTFPDALSLGGLFQTLTKAEEVRAQSHQQGLGDFCRVLLTRVLPHPNPDGKETREILEQAQIPLFISQISQRSAVTRCALHGGLVGADKNPGGLIAAREYQAASRGLAQLLGVAPA